VSTSLAAFHCHVKYNYAHNLFYGCVYMSRTWHLTPHYMSGSPNSHAITKTTRTLIPVLSLIPTETLLTLLNPTNPNSTSKITKLTSFRWTKRSWRCCTCECISSRTITGYQPVLGLTDFLMSSVFGSIANLKGPYFQPSLCVWLCVCLCVSDRHFYPLTLTDFDETLSQGPYSDLVWPQP